MRTLAVSAFVVSMLLLAGMVGWLIYDASSGPASDQPALVVQCGAGMRKPLEAIIKQYEKETGKRVEARYGGSQTVLTNMQVTGQGDLFLPGDASYIDLAREKNLIAEVFPLSQMQVVLLVNPAYQGSLTSLEELLAADIRIAQTEPGAAAIGKLTRETLEKSNHWQALEKKTTVFMGNVAEVGNAVKLGSVDAGLVWDAVAINYPGMKVIHLPELDAITSKVQLAVVKPSKQPTEALRFARFVAARDKGLPLFKKHGFELVEKGDKYAKTPKILVYGGSMLRPVMDGVVDDFARREGVEIVRSYNGCGILVGQMKAGDRPDLYFACDTQFMAKVKDHFEPAAIVTSNQLVIAVPKSNPKKLKSLQDLGSSKMRVGVGHEQQCAMGAITKETFIKAGVYKTVSENVVVESPTGDMLINQLRTGSLDAVVAYRSNTHRDDGVPYEDIEAVPVEGIPCAFPEQPVAISNTSEFPNLTRRLVDALTSPEARRRFETQGFGWRFPAEKN